MNSPYNTYNSKPNAINTNVLIGQFLSINIISFVETAIAYRFE